MKEIAHTDRTIGELMQTALESSIKNSCFYLTVRADPRFAAKLERERNY